MAESAILDWEKEPGNQELLNTIFRGFHTIKEICLPQSDCVKDLPIMWNQCWPGSGTAMINFTAGHGPIWPLNRWT